MASLMPLSPSVRPAMPRRIPDVASGSLPVRRVTRIFQILLWIMPIVLPLGRARGDIFRLHDGGEVHGELLNKDESPRKNFLVKTAAGGKITLDESQVK